MTVHVAVRKGAEIVFWPGKDLTYEGKVLCLPEHSGFIARNSSRPSQITIWSLGQWSPWCDFRGRWASKSEKEKYFLCLLTDVQCLLTYRWLKSLHKGKYESKNIFLWQPKLGYQILGTYDMPLLVPVTADIIKFSLPCWAWKQLQKLSQYSSLGNNCQWFKLA